jgi:predicted ester cyclase
MTHSGDFAGAPATGKRVTVHGISIMRFEGGKIAEAWDNWDQLGLLTQIGAFPTPDLARAS